MTHQPRVHLIEFGGLTNEYLKCTLLLLLSSVTLLTHPFTLFAWTCVLKCYPLFRMSTKLFIPLFIPSVACLGVCVTSRTVLVIKPVTPHCWQTLHGLYSGCAQGMSVRCTINAIFMVFMYFVYKYCNVWFCVPFLHTLIYLWTCGHSTLLWLFILFIVNAYNNW